MSKYKFIVPSSAAGVSQVHWDLYNNTATRDMKVTRVFARSLRNVAVTGVITNVLALTRTTAVGTGGTAATENDTSLANPSIVEIEPSAGSIPSAVTARARPTGGATAGALIAIRELQSEETSAAEGHIDFLRPGETITVPPGSGLRLLQDATASPVGTLGFEVDYEIMRD